MANIARLDIEHQPPTPVLELGPRGVPLGEEFLVLVADFANGVKNPPSLAAYVGQEAIFALQGSADGGDHFNASRGHYDAFARGFGRETQRDGNAAPCLSLGRSG